MNSKEMIEAIRRLHIFHTDEQDWKRRYGTSTSDDVTLLMLQKECDELGGNLDIKHMIEAYSTTAKDGDFKQLMRHKVWAQLKSDKDFRRRFFTAKVTDQPLPEELKDHDREVLDNMNPVILYLLCPPLTSSPHNEHGILVPFSTKPGDLTEEQQLKIKLDLLSFTQELMTFYPQGVLFSDPLVIEKRYDALPTPCRRIDAIAFVCDIFDNIATVVNSEYMREANMDIQQNLVDLECEESDFWIDDNYNLWRIVPLINGYNFVCYNHKEHSYTIYLAQPFHKQGLIDCWIQHPSCNEKQCTHEPIGNTEYRECYLELSDNGNTMRFGKRCKNGNKAGVMPFPQQLQRIDAKQRLQYKTVIDDIEGERFHDAFPEYAINGIPCQQLIGSDYIYVEHETLPAASPEDTPHVKSWYRIPRFGLYEGVSKTLNDLSSVGVNDNILKIEMRGRTYILFIELVISIDVTDDAMLQQQDIQIVGGLNVLG